MTTNLNNIFSDIIRFLRRAFATGSLNPNTAAGAASWDRTFEPEMPVSKPKLPAMRSSDRSLPLGLRLQALEAELASFDEALPRIHNYQFTDTDSIS